jgi:F-type H+-transporting ATPase subunit b
MFSTTFQIVGIEIIPGLVLVQAVIFLFVFWFLNTVLFKPLMAVLKERQEKTEGSARGADDIEAKAEAALQEYKDKFRQARREALDIKKKFVAEGVEVKEATLEKARQEASASLDQIREKIAQEAKTARETLRGEVETVGKSLAQKVLGRDISA